ncbi:MAG: RNA polymerase sigma factor, partial [Actinomycetota bacterium]
FKALYFVTGNRADAAELMQDAFLKLWERWDTIDRIDDPTAYLFRVALNGSRMRARSARRATRRMVAPTSSHDPFDEIDIREDVRQMLLGLAPRQRAALVLLDLYGYGSEHAARIMGIRPSTVRALATQGRAVLRTAATTGGPHG